MLFYSVEFAVFFTLVFFLYWFITDKNLKLQNLLIVAASYIFYGWWSWIFLVIIFFSTIINFVVSSSFAAENNQKRRKALLFISLFFNLGFLAIFKYYNFFIANFNYILSLFNFGNLNTNSSALILPVGLSFYTFQIMGYTIDVYRRKVDPAKNFIAFSAFVCFFPLLLAGPIERADNLLTQFNKNRFFDRAHSVDGLKQILWGLFKKIVIADNCAEFANRIFDSQNGFSGSTLALGAVLYSFQIYCDFSGYSDIAIGSSKLLGFELKRNFAFPYFSRDIAEFWRRWHISLSSWFRDYLFLPLSFSISRKLPDSVYLGMKTESIIYNISTLVTFTLCGFWHGASWTFIFWGFLNGVYFIPLFYRKKKRKITEIVAKGKLLPSIKDIFSMTVTFSLISAGWIFFRAESISAGFIYLINIFRNDLFSLPEILPVSLFLIVLMFIIIEWIGREKSYALEIIGVSWKRRYRWAVYYFLIFTLVISAGKQQEFIYFQF